MLPTKMLRAVLVLTVLWVAALARPSDVLKELIDALEEKEMDDKNIYDMDSNANSIAVQLQKSTSWGGSFKVSLYYLPTNLMDMPATALFEGKTWDDILKMPSPDWGRLAGFKATVSINGLESNTQYTVYTIVVNSSGKVIASQFRNIKTKGSTSSNDILKELAILLGKD